MARKGNASLRAAKSAGAPSYVGKNVRARAGKVIAGAGRLPNGIAACHRVSDKRFRTISKATLEKLGDSSLPVAKRKKILSSFTDLTSAIGGPKLKRKVQLERRKNFAAMLAKRATDPSPKALTAKEQRLALDATTDMANHAPDNFFLGDSSNNSSIGERQDARLLPSAKKGGKRSPSPVSLRIARHTMDTLNELGEPVSPRLKALAGGSVPSGFKTSATD
ncbi:hypothetical protein HUF18_14730 [Thalassolituus sp. ST750PaO-4]|uniref:hypothetical protein n=1 Tax=Thalassolituus sp. ST750PaO-4 TaxID=2742965 RepID=UPI001CE2DED1|nr:hypothetical protein [Thalassolituus sp. ST750PaO-4]MCA6061031.1 hypothetical protein [Thalassolituus sp. ST750PaO-4]